MKDSRERFGSLQTLQLPGRLLCLFALVRCFFRRHNQVACPLSVVGRWALTLGRNSGIQAQVVDNDDPAGFAACSVPI